MIYPTRALLALSLVASLATAEHLRPQARRLRMFEDSNALGHLPAPFNKLDFLFGTLEKIQTLSLETQDTQAELASDQEDFDELLDAFRRVGLSMDPSDAPSDVPSGAPTDTPTTAPSRSIPVLTTPAPTIPNAATAAPTDAPVAAPLTDSPTSQPSAAVGTLFTPSPTAAPTTSDCRIPEEQRIIEILAQLDAAADPLDVRNTAIPQGKATTWLLLDDDYHICPDDPKVVQRWALAVIYYSTNGDSWFQCSSNPTANDACGFDAPFVGDARFLSGVFECLWAGISCIDGCVTEIEFEENNLIGTIPTEIGLLSDLAIWGMERGGLTGTIPTEVGLLTNLIFIDLDFNELSGSLSSELLSLSSLTQLDLNNNELTGSISGIGGFPEMEFLQLHDNFFTGTVPEALGSYSNLVAFTLHETSISGAMPTGVCDLLLTEPNGGVLASLIADCGGPSPDITCACCTDCRAT